MHNKTRRTYLARTVATRIQTTTMSNPSHPGINPEAKPSGTGCADCLQEGAWWFHLRRCAACGHVGCCDSSPSQHATRHFHTTQHAIMQSFEPGESWFWDYTRNRNVDGPALAAPHHHPADQPIPGPAGKVPADWQSKLHK